MTHQCCLGLCWKGPYNVPHLIGPNHCFLATPCHAKRGLLRSDHGGQFVAEGSGAGSGKRHIIFLLISTWVTSMVYTRL